MALTLFLAEHLLALAVLAATAWAAGSLAGFLSPRTLSWRGRDDWAERLAVPAALGLAVLGHLGFLLATLGLLRPGILITAIAAIHAAAIPLWRSAFADFSLSYARRIDSGGAPLRRLAAGLLALGPLFVLAVYPPTAFDEILYHLPFARAFAESGALPLTPALRFPVFPALAEVIFAEILLLADDVVPHFVALLAIVATAGLLVAWGRRAFTPKVGWIAAALYLGNPIVVYLTGTAYVEPLLALFVTGALFSAWIFRHTGERPWLLAAAAFAGSAAGVKYLGLFFAAAVFADLLFHGRKPTPLYRSAPVLFALIAFMALAPTHARIVSHTGNPLFPYLPGIFGSTSWDPIALKPLGEHLSTDTVVRFVRLPWDVVFHRSAVGRQPPFSPFYLLGLPLLIVGAVRDPRIRRLLAIPFAWAVVFLLLPRDSRYLVPILPPLSLALAWVIVELGKLERRVWLAAVCALAFLPGWLYAGYRIGKQGPPPATAQQRDLYLARALPLYPAIRHLDRISTVAYAYNAERMKYYYRGELYGDWIGPSRFRRFLPLLETPRILHRDLHGLGATHLLIAKGDTKPPPTAEWDRWFVKVYEDAGAEIYELAR